MLDEVIAFLTDKNREYFEGEADHNWSACAVSCNHTLRNALAAANIWSPLSVRVVALLSDQCFVDLGADLQYFERRYDVILADYDERCDTLRVSVERRSVGLSASIAVTLAASGTRFGPCWVAPPRHR